MQKLRNALASVLAKLSIKLMAWAVDLSPGSMVTPELSGGPREPA